MLGWWEETGHEGPSGTLLTGWEHLARWVWEPRVKTAQFQCHLAGKRPPRVGGDVS